MEIEVIDTTGLKTPNTLLKIALKTAGERPGQIFEIWGDCLRLENDIRTWCSRLSKVVLSVRETSGGNKKIHIQL